MGLSGPQLDQTFGSGFSPVKAITGFNAYLLNRPSASVADPAGDVTEQGHRAEITWDAATKTLKIAAAGAGEGLWIPYLGNGTGQPEAKGWGTYSRPVSHESWVATGPFSGCFVAAFSGGGRRFAHLITPAAGHPAATVDEQIAAIKAATGADSFTKWPMDGAGLGIAFFLKLGGAWVRRFAWVAPTGAVMQINARSTAI